MAYSVYVNYKNNARPLDDKASGEYERNFETKRAAWDYIKEVGRHADAKPYITVDVTVIELVNYERVWRNVWNAR